VSHAACSAVALDKPQWPVRFSAAHVACSIAAPMTIVLPIQLSVAREVRVRD
jgi:hypothetical protein